MQTEDIVTQLEPDWISTMISVLGSSISIHENMYFQQEQADDDANINPGNYKHSISILLTRLGKSFIAN